mmetsp:Transcript_51089/g.121383  ORF Transcript_51089/g.121383 Transcript_51089/m.121383 type:complete len:220 (+) Transcript_51089:63-722(+)
MCAGHLGLPPRFAVRSGKEAASKTSSSSRCQRWQQQLRAASGRRGRQSLLGLVLLGVLAQMLPVVSFSCLSLSSGGSLSLSSGGRRVGVSMGAASQDSDRPHLTDLSAGDRLVGWLKHPVLTKREKFNLVIEVGPGNDEGTWRIEDNTNEKLKSRRGDFEGPFKIRRDSESGQLELEDEYTSLIATLNGDGPGTLSGIVSQCGLTWEGFFSAALEVEED